MGIAVPSQLFGRQHLIQFTMKSFAAALVAVASAAPEAQPWLGYAGLGYGYGGYPYAYATPALVAHPNGAVTPPYTPAQLAAAADHFAAMARGPLMPTTDMVGMVDMARGPLMPTTEDMVDMDTEDRIYYAYGFPGYGYY